VAQAKGDTPMALQFQRNAKVYVEMAGTSPGTAVFQIPVLAGFSFSQSMNSSEVTVNEAGIASRRARLLFNDSLAPVEWSFSTYIRPIAATSPTAIVAPEQPLWAMLMGANAYNQVSRQFASTIAQGVAGSPTNGSPSPMGSPSPTTSPTGFQAVNSGSIVGTANTFDFSASNTSYFGAGVNIWFAFVDGGGSNTEYFKLTDSVVNSVTVDFDIEGIATAQWSGFATSLSNSATPSWLTSGSPTSSVQTTGVVDTTNFIRNKLSTVTLMRNSNSDEYNVILTGGSFTVENNISYLIPEQLGVVNQPIGNITGTRSISGSLTCYYDDTSTASSELFTDQLGDISTVRNSFDLAISIGGTTGPRLELDLPTAHVEIPTIGVDDLLTLEINFHGQVNNGNVDNTDEATIVYKA
jgi:hypothetical protein